MRKYFVLFFLILFFLPLTTEALSVGDRKNFFVEDSYDSDKRSRLSAEMKVLTDNLYFYVDSSWYEELSERERIKYLDILENLGEEFENNIFPVISSDFGSTPKSKNLVKDDHVFVLFHPMNYNAGGYFRTGDQHSIYQHSRSNEKNIVYLNTDFIESSNLPGYLAHEYIHLVTYNEKNKKYGVNEEVWLNELRAELIISILGYNNDFEESNLYYRKDNFLRDPDFSLTDWSEQVADYGVVNLFGHYLIDHYGVEIIQDSLQSGIVGIPSIDYALDINGYDKTFSEIFTDWTIAVFLNDCSYGELYCYKNENLQDVEVLPATAFITSESEKTFEIEYKTKNWAGNWHKITGEDGTLYVNFESDRRFVVPYILCKDNKDCKIEFLDLNKGKTSFVVENFNSTYNSVTLIPSLQEKFTGFNGPGRSFVFKWEAEIKRELTKSELQEISEKVKEIRERIEEIKNILEKREEMFDVNLHYGMRESEEVKRLQEFLKEQGSDIYEEGYITGNFFDMTKRAVIRFQEKHKEDILKPFNIENGTGFVGELTRKKMNELILER